MYCYCVITFLEQGGCNGCAWIYLTRMRAKLRARQGQNMIGLVKSRSFTGGATHAKISTSGEIDGYNSQCLDRGCQGSSAEYGQWCKARRWCRIIVCYNLCSHQQLYDSKLIYKMVHSEHRYWFAQYVPSKVVQSKSCTVRPCVYYGRFDSSYCKIWAHIHIAPYA